LVNDKGKSGEQINRFPAPKIHNIEMTIPLTTIAFIGNSFFYYNNGITSYLNEMVVEGIPKQKKTFSQITISGSGLSWHNVESYLDPKCIVRYSFDSANNVIFNDPEQKLFDVVILQDNSQGPVHPQLKSVFVEYVKRHCDTIRRHGAIPVLFMSWAYTGRPEMTEQLATAYTQVGNENDALVIPAGLAFAESLAKRPDIKLVTEDKKHPTPEGTYLSAATVYAAIFKNSPVGLKYNGGLDDAVTRHLQEIAWETIQAYYGRG
jgi:hypothetical protein